MKAKWAVIGKRALAALAAMGLAACSPDAGGEVAEVETAPSVATHPVSGLEIIPVTITTGESSHVIQAELAATPQDQARGLMFRNELGPDEGMIFPYPDVRPLSFWMRNTVIPLDLIFIDEANTVINIGKGVPYSETSIASERPGIAVLELYEGRAEELGIEPGDTIEW